MVDIKKSIVLCTNPDCDPDFTITLRAKQILENAGYTALTTIIPGRNRDFTLPHLLHPIPLEAAAKSAKLLIVFGGDGTILRTARAVIKTPLPLLGVNLGHMGFMAQLESEELPLILEAAAEKYTPIKRMMLDVELIRNSELIFSDSVLNDTVVGCTARAMNLAAYGDGSMIASYSGDGVVIATPTGSTAYSLSAGGPLVEPTAENILLTPICAHLMNVRPFVLASDRVVTITTSNNSGKKLWISMDGCEPIPIYDGDELRIKKSENCSIMVQLPGKSFYDIAYKKLGG